MASFNNTKGGDIEGQIKNNLAKPTKLEELSVEQLRDYLDFQTLTLHYSCSIVIPRLEGVIDNTCELLNAMREKDIEALNNSQKDNDIVVFIPLFNFALDEEGYEILAWSEEEDSTVRTPTQKLHVQGTIDKTGDA